MRPEADRFKRGSIAWVTANVAKKLVSKSGVDRIGQHKRISYYRLAVGAGVRM